MFAHWKIIVYLLKITNLAVRVRKIKLPGFTVLTWSDLKRPFEISSVFQVDLGNRKLHLFINYNLPSLYG